MTVNHELIEQGSTPPDATAGETDLGPSGLRDRARVRAKFQATIRRRRRARR
jgi:hypothetical protein